MGRELNPKMGKWTLSKLEQAFCRDFYYYEGQGYQCFVFYSIGYCCQKVWN